LFETPRKRRHWVDVSCAWKTECSEPRHTLYPHVINLEPRVVTGEGTIRMLCFAN
jgi:hypothetical protein